MITTEELARNARLAAAAPVPRPPVAVWVSIGGTSDTYHDDVECWARPESRRIPTLEAYALSARLTLCGTCEHKRKFERGEG